MTKRTKGSLEVICGPMFSGKSEELIRRLRRAKIARQNVVTFKHAWDKRKTENCEATTEFVVSHNGAKIECHAIENMKELLTCADQADVVGFDEVQWFGNEAIAAICQLVDAGKRVIVAGLDLDFRKVPFGVIPTLMAIADKVTKLPAICNMCGSDAYFTQRVVEGKPARYSDPVVLAGAQESYQARCRNCHQIDQQHNFNPTHKTDT